MQIAYAPPPSSLRTTARNARRLVWEGARESFRMLALLVIWLPAKLATLIMLVLSLSEFFKALQYWHQHKPFEAACALLVIPAVFYVGAVVKRLQHWLRTAGREWQ